VTARGRFVQTLRSRPDESGGTRFEYSKKEIKNSPIVLFFAYGDQSVGGRQHRKNNGIENRALAARRREELFDK